MYHSLRTGKTEIKVRQVRFLMNVLGTLNLCIMRFFTSSKNTLLMVCNIKNNKHL